MSFFFFMAKGVMADIVHQMKHVYGEYCLGRTAVNNCCQRFRQGIQKSKRDQDQTRFTLPSSIHQICHCRFDD